MHSSSNQDRYFITLSLSFFPYTGLIASCGRLSAGCVFASKDGLCGKSSGGTGTAHLSATFDVSEMGLSIETSGGGGGTGHLCVVVFDASDW